MNGRGQGNLIGGRRSRREVVDIPEPKKKDKSIDNLISVHRQRLDRLQRECIEARHAWRAARAELHASKLRWREAVAEAADFWQEARAEFFRMTTTSGDFRRAKAVYERMKEQAEDVHLESRTVAASCKTARTAFFEARRKAIEGNRRYEKLGMLRDELRSQMVEMEM